MVDPGMNHWSIAEHVLLSGVGIRRLLMACAMGGAVGVEREFRHKDSGLRTNMLLCMGAALYTIMSIELAGDSTPNKGQVAANIVQGIGFLGAGLILHTKNKILGLTSAATVFVVAAIGMTCGAGMYLEALAATVLVLVMLQFVGVAEVRIGWHRYSMIYEVRADVGRCECIVVQDAVRNFKGAGCGGAADDCIRTGQRCGSGTRGVQRDSDAAYAHTASARPEG